MQGRSQLRTLHEDVTGGAGHAAGLLGDNAGVRHRALDLSQHMQRDGLLRHRMQRSRLQLHKRPGRLRACTAHHELSNLYTKARSACAAEQLHCLYRSEDISKAILHQPILLPGPMPYIREFMHMLLQHPQIA